MANDEVPAELATALAQMARDLLAQDSLQETLDRIARHAVNLVQGCEAAGIMVLQNRRVHTLAATDDLVLTSDRIQGEVGQGPCFDAVRTKAESYLVEDMRDEAERWPRYVPHARELGIGSMIGFKLFTEEENLGALDLYSSRPGALNDYSEQVGWLLASHAAVAFANARAEADLHIAISSRQDIGMAVGILMERHKLSTDQAFALLSRASQERNVKLREIARRVVETGESPDSA
ncbi:GAF and ANTAR domain-containing protein [Actinoallomurus iriomotensis]|uniref:Transcription antitermination regulator n=1 Tax=Actinoallomurus iriomotensis TaxID=478107 RepID=A0A9W6RQZ2_9ACTN|nr:GAF and ANTAR domain-containing protein [Actinoallomurus iriomotensis]GLY78552.1 transcription antitermination regulator [Actinoallomurus iriomotensis]